MKLAEHRYGKEDLLALFDTTVQEDVQPPQGEEWLKSFNLWVTKVLK